MANFTLGHSEEQEFETIPVDTLAKAEVVKVDVAESPFWVDEDDHAKGKKEQVSFRFRINEGEFEGRQLFGNTPTTFTDHPDCKLSGWVREILDLDEFPTDFSFDTEQLEGCSVNIIVGHRRSGKEFVDTVARIDGVDFADDIF